MSSKTFIVVFFVLTTTSQLWAQTEHSALLEGSQAYQGGNFQTAISHFQQAVDKNEESLKGHYNLGNSFYKDKQYEAAVSHFQRASEQASNNQQKAQALYNLGNSYLAQAQAQEAPNKDSKTQLESAIEAYKSALRNNPKDFEAKNNLATAYKLLRQQQPPQKEQQDQKKQQSDQDQQQDQEDKEQDSSDKKNQKKQQGDQQDQQNPQEAPKEQPIDNTNEQKPSAASPKEMSKAEAKRLLQVVAEDDKDVQERLMQRQQQPPRKGDKTW
ncbi:MAG: tetratricopeptide repeat protein [Aureispira sp.]